MANVSTELQKAVFSALSSVYEVYEVVPTDTSMPYITIGDEIVTHNNTKTSIRTVHNITIHTWSKGNSSAESKAMNDFVVKTILNELNISGFELDLVTLELLTTDREQASDGTIFHGVIQFEITITN